MRKLLVIVFSCLVLLMAGYATFRGYKVWKNNHLMSLGHEFLAKNDVRNALITLKEVLRSDPENVDATRLMAQLMDASRSPSALLWRSRAVELNPRSLSDRLALAQTALTMRDYASATNALEGVDPSDKKTASFQNMAGTVAAAANRPAEAETYFLESSRLDPQNPAPQLNLAVIRLHMTNDADLEKARSALQFLAFGSTNAALRSQALRELTADALRHKKMDIALNLSQQLLQETNLAFGDRILRLEVLKDGTNAAFPQTLASFQKEAGVDSAKIYELARWEMAKTSPQSTLDWLRSLPAETKTNQPVTSLIAECYGASQDWAGLRSWLEKQNWNELDFVRHALLSKALREQALGDTAKIEWISALNAAHGQKQGLIMLLRLAAQWHWTSEGQQLLSTIVTRFPEEKWAAPALTQVLYVSGQTRLLLDLFGQEFKRAPSDLNMKNNLAMVALLLDAKEYKPHELAKEVYDKSPTNSSYIATYAFSLYLEGKKADALKVMQEIKPQELSSPSVAGYYGMILESVGSEAKAKEYIDLSSRAMLLPEERKVFAQARAPGK